jgi:AbrB family looped-hinge helix DNA binding protein
VTGVTITHRPKPVRARITRQGQISVPKAVRDALGLEPGDELEFTLRATDAIVTARPARSVLDFAGIARDKSDRIPATAAGMDEVIRQAMARRRR